MALQKSASQAATEVAVEVGGMRRST